VTKTKKAARRRLLNSKQVIAYHAAINAVALTCGHDLIDQQTGAAWAILVGAHKRC
jgi:hypothetical protein